MSTNATDDTGGGGIEDEQERARYAPLNVGDEEFVIYDRENHRAWIQSTVALSSEDYR